MNRHWPTWRSSADNIFRLGVKELWRLWRDPAMLFLIVYAFTVAVYSAGTVMPETLNRSPIAVVDEDDSTLSRQVISAFYPPYFKQPKHIGLADVDPAMDAGLYTFVVVIPINFQRDVLAGQVPAVQLNIDATRMSQAFMGNSAIQQILMEEVFAFAKRHRRMEPLPVELVPRMRFNPALNQTWFGSLMEVVNQITILSIILTGAALIREREHGTVEHLLVMPVTPIEIMLAKIWSMALVVLLATAFSLGFVIQGILQVPIEGSLVLFLIGAILHLFATTSMGIFMATVARSMPQFGLLMILTIMPLELLSGGLTPRESMPVWIQNLMSVAPTTHFTELSQAILYRAAGLAVVWWNFLALLVIGVVFFALSLARLRKTISNLY